MFLVLLQMLRVGKPNKCECVETNAAYKGCSGRTSSSESAVAKTQQFARTDWDQPLLHEIRCDGGHHPHRIGMSESCLPRREEVIPGPFNVHRITAGPRGRGDRTVRLETLNHRPDGNRCGPAETHRLEELRYLVR